MGTYRQRTASYLGLAPEPAGAMDRRAKPAFWAFMVLGTGLLIAAEFVIALGGRLLIAAVILPPVMLLALRVVKLRPSNRRTPNT